MLILHLVIILGYVVQLNFVKKIDTNKKAQLI